MSDGGLFDNDQGTVPAQQSEDYNTTYAASPTPVTKADTDNPSSTNPPALSTADSNTLASLSLDTTVHNPAPVNSNTANSSDFWAVDNSEDHSTLNRTTGATLASESATTGSISTTNELAKSGGGISSIADSTTGSSPVPTTAGSNNNTSASRNTADLPSVTGGIGEGIGAADIPTDSSTVLTSSHIGTVYTSTSPLTSSDISSSDSAPDSHSVILLVGSVEGHDTTESHTGVLLDLPRSGTVGTDKGTIDQDLIEKFGQLNVQNDDTSDELSPDCIAKCGIDNPEVDSNDLVDQQRENVESDAGDFVVVENAEFQSKYLDVHRNPVSSPSEEDVCSDVCEMDCGTTLETEVDLEWVEADGKTGCIHSGIAADKPLLSLVTAGQQGCNREINHDSEFSKLTASHDMPRGSKPKVTPMAHTTQGSMAGVKEGEVANHQSRPQIPPNTKAKDYKVRSRRIQELRALGFEEHCQELLKDPYLKITFSTDTIVFNSTVNYEKFVRSQLQQFLESLRVCPLDLDQVSLKLLKQFPEALKRLNNELQQRGVHCYVRSENDVFKAVTRTDHDAFDARKVILGLLPIFTSEVDGCSGREMQSSNRKFCADLNQTCRGFFSTDLLELEKDKRYQFHVVSFADTADMVFSKFGTHFLHEHHNVTEPTPHGSQQKVATHLALPNVPTFPRTTANVGTHKSKVTDAPQNITMVQDTVGQKLTVHGSHKGDNSFASQSGPNQLNTNTDVVIHDRQAAVQQQGTKCLLPRVDHVCDKNKSDFHQDLSGVENLPLPGAATEKHGLFVQVPASAGITDQHSALASGTGQPVQKDVHNQTRQGDDPKSVQSDGRSHHELGQKSFLRVPISHLTAKLLSHQDVWKDFVYALAQVDVLVSNDEVSQSCLLLKTGTEESLRNILKSFFTETVITVDEKDQLAHAKIESLQTYHKYHFVADFIQAGNQCKLCFLGTIEKQIRPILQECITFEEHIPLPMYKVKYCLCHLKELTQACEREDPGNLHLEVKGYNGKMCLQVKASRHKCRQIMNFVHRQLAQIVMRETDITTAMGLYLKDYPVSNQCVQSIEASSGCLLSVRLPVQSMQLHAKSPKGQELMLCDGSIAESDCQVLLIPLYEGQTRWPYVYEQILKKGFLPEEMTRYLNEVGSPEQRMTKYTMTLDCNKDLAGRKVVVMFVAQKDLTKFKHYLRDACREAMEAAFSSSSSVALQLDLENDIWASRKAWKVILSTVISTLESSTSDKKVKLFLNMQTSCALDLCRCIEDFIVQRKWAVSSCFKRDSRAENHIRVVVDEVQTIKADVYVNSTDEKLTHENGHVSKILLAKAGELLTKHCQELYPEGIGDNVVALTNSFNLKNFKWIFHIALHGVWEEQNAAKHLQELKVRVQACLALASALGCCSIALPTLGLGRLEYPPVRVAKTMFSAAREFFMEMPHSTLECVFIMCYHKDHKITQVFKVEEALCNPRNWNIDGRTLEIKDAQVIILHGDHHALELGANITVCGPHFKGNFEEYKKTSEAKGSIVLQWTSNKAKDVVKYACKLCSEDRKRISLQINMQSIGQGCYDEMITALASELHHVLVVYLVVASNDDLHAVAGKLKQVMTTRNNKFKWPSMNFWSSDSASNDTTASSGGTYVQEENRGSVQIIGPWSDTLMAENCVLTTPVPEGYTRRAHEYEKKKREGCSVDKKTSQYDCQGCSVQPQDAVGHEGAEDKIKDVMREGTAKESSSGGSDICKFTIPVEQVISIDKDIFDQSLKHETKGMLQGYSEEGQDLVFRAKFENLDRVVSLVWRIVRKLSGVESQDFSMDFDVLEYEALRHLLGPTFCQSVSIVKEDGGKVSVSSKGEKPAWLDKYSLLRREDVQLPADELRRLGQEPLDTSEENLEAFIKPLHDQGRVAILTFDYNAITKAKHLVSVRAGKVKVTARARRRFEGVGQGEHSPTQSIDSVSPQSVTLNSKEFTTKSGIKVQVYRTDITKLPVDAIVNAANDHLAHGGGVAAAIARAAGMTLEDEGNAYIMRNGPLKVTEVVPTTAGAMPCKKVLHAVGPRWDDYLDKVQCQQDLEQTVFNCLVFAHDGQCSSLAVSSISSAIFGVPKELCAKMYLSAVKSFDRKYGRRTSVQVIHFVDVSDHMVSVIQDIFTKGWDTDGTALGDNGTLNIRQGGAPPSEKSYTVSPNSSPQTGYRSSAVGDVSSISQSGQGTRYPLGEVQTDPPHTWRQQSNQGDANVTAVMNTGSRQNDQFTVRLVNLDLIFWQQRVSGIQADAVVLWQYTDCVLESEDSKQLLKGLTSSDVSKFKYKLTDGVVEVIETKEKLCIFPVLASGFTTKERFCTLFEQAVNEAEMRGKESVAVTCFSSQPGLKCARKTNKDVAEYAAGVYLAIKKYSDQEYKSVRKVYILETDVDTLRAIEKTVGEMLAIEEKCVICQDKITDLKTMKCGHVFCAKCIDLWINMKPVCPCCQAVLGVMTGNQPTDGTMRMSYSSNVLLPEYQYSAYVINYSFPPGKQSNEHPNPGRSYGATSRTAYLPDTPEGRKVLMLLKVAFDRRLVFTVGRSTTTGKDDCIIWNDIHHKTNTYGGSANYGYPDPTYLTRVEKELAAKGVTSGDLTVKQKDFIENPVQYHHHLGMDFYHKV